MLFRDQFMLKYNKDQCIPGILKAAVQFHLIMIRIGTLFGNQLVGDNPSISHKD